MIIVEGCDGSGKSTLINELSAEFGLLIHDAGPRDELHKLEPKRSFAAMTDFLLTPDMAPVIHDRLFLSELVYGSIMREVNFTQLQEDVLWDILYLSHCPVIICDPGWDVVFHNFSESDQLEGVAEVHEKVHTRYANTISQTLIKRRCNYIPYNYQDPTTKYKVFTTVAQYIQDKEAKTDANRNS